MKQLVKRPKGFGEINCGAPPLPKREQAVFELRVSGWNKKP
jgi:hypothetical protein